MREEYKEATNIKTTLQNRKTESRRDSI